MILDWLFVYMPFITIGAAVLFGLFLPIAFGRQKLFEKLFDAVDMACLATLVLWFGVLLTRGCPV